MARRVAISVRGLVGQRLEDYCKANGQSMSGALEEFIHADLDTKGVPMPEDDPKPEKSTSKSRSSEEIISQHFTF